ncbi:hypothetical protein M0813_27884 [Anaeramoeba flamelloides]|uniref:Uncharacterized protein n=1 Tax=Anaeramoeba flamelloides TaxID=1746091 RepID=A0ABQ8XV72_9EUKA|nr:hypothetical protein M0813_27884 [Anaeramoeba flamelloides]
MSLTKTSSLTNEDYNETKNPISEETQSSFQSIEEELDYLKEKAMDDRQKFQKQIQTLKKQLQHGIGSLEDANEKRNKLAKKSQKLKRDRFKLMEQITKAKKKMILLSKNNQILHKKVRELLPNSTLVNETNIETNLTNERFDTININKFERPFCSMSDLTDRSELTETTDNEEFDFSNKSQNYKTLNRKTLKKTGTVKKKFLTMRSFKKKKITKIKKKKKFKSTTHLNTRLKINTINTKTNKNPQTNSQVQVKKKEKNKIWSKHLIRRKSINAINLTNTKNN